jgi:hypothetical protein
MRRRIDRLELDPFPDFCEIRVRAFGIDGDGHLVIKTRMLDFGQMPGDKLPECFIGHLLSTLVIVWRTHW